MAQTYIVIFVEGETEKEFYDALIQHYKTQSSTSLMRYKVINMKGIGRFENKVRLKLQNEILKKEKANNVGVVCCYDTDVFDLAQKPPVNWDNVKAKITALGIPIFLEIKAKQMIEDWFLSDLQGICSFLKIKAPKKIEGKNGNDKMMKLFKKGSKLYIKGTLTKKFIPSLNLETIRINAKNQLAPLEKLLNVKLKQIPRK